MLTDFQGMAMKALALAAKVVINMLLGMLKRPIMHWDPALQCAHVMLYYRAPYNPNEKQTAILLRDMIDNGTYEWIKLDPAIVADSVWMKTACNSITAVKANAKYGYKAIDGTTKYKMYKKVPVQWGMISCACACTPGCVCAPVHWV